MNNKQIYIKTTESCNLHCKHCYIGDARKKVYFFNEVKTVEWILDWIKYNNLDVNDLLISFHGGEPMICPTNKIKYVCEKLKGATFNTTTNLAYTLDNDKLDLFVNHFIDKEINKPFIKTSWDYKIRFLDDNSYNLWKQNIKTLKDNGVIIQVIVCLTSLLINEVSPYEFLKLFKDLGIDIISFERLTSNTTDEKWLIPDYKKQDEWIFNVYKINEQEFHLSLGLVTDIINAINGSFLGCRERKCMQKVITINADGTIGGCPNTALKKPFGNIYNTSGEIFNNPCRLCSIQNEQIRDTRCYTCELFNICNGDCHQLSWQDDVCPAPKKLMYELKHKYSYNN